MSQVIKVSKEHIKYGFRRSAWACPIAMALRDAGFDSPEVLDCIIIFKNESGGYVETTLPFPARNFVRRYDKWLKCEPFEFELNI